MCKNWCVWCGRPQNARFKNPVYVNCDPVVDLGSPTGHMPKLVCLVWPAPKCLIQKSSIKYVNCCPLVNLMVNLNLFVHFQNIWLFSVWVYWYTLKPLIGILSKTGFTDTILTQKSSTPSTSPLCPYSPPPVNKSLWCASWRPFAHLIKACVCCGGLSGPIFRRRSGI